MKALTSFELVLTIGILIAVGIAMIQLRGLFTSQLQLAREEVVVIFAKNLESAVDKAVATTGDVSFSYTPPIENYTVTVTSKSVSILDRTTKSIASFVKNIEFVPSSIENAKKIFVIKEEGKIKISG